MTLKWYQNLSLDDRLYCLQQTILPDDLSAKLVKADVLFLQDKDPQSLILVLEIEEACEQLGIEIHQPANVLLFR